MPVGAPCLFETANGTDSNVCLHCIAKGRSPSCLLNGLMRHHSAICLMAHREQTNFKLPTGDNPSDDPSRRVPPHARQEPAWWLTQVLGPEPLLPTLKPMLPAELRMFREGWAGAAGLTEAVARKGLNVGRPMEASPSHVEPGQLRYLRIFDLTDPDTLAYVEMEINMGLYLAWLFGISCTSWSAAGRLNGGTRRRDNPDGGPQLLPREVLGNRHASIMVSLCIRLVDKGCFFSIENPLDSYLWICSMFDRLWSHCSGKDWKFDFDQCAFGLKLPGCSHHEYCRKSTSVVTNIPDLQFLQRRCPGRGQKHRRVAAWGTVSVNGRTYHRAACAGRCPPMLCHVWGSLVAVFPKRTFDI